MSKKISILIFSILVLCVVAGAALAWTTVGDGIEYQFFTISGPNNVYVARMDRSNTNASIDTTIAYDMLAGARENITNQSSRIDDAITWWGDSWGQRNDVVIAINGGFFDGYTGILAGGQNQSGWYARSQDDMGGFSGFAWTTGRVPFIGQCVYHDPSANRVYFPSTGNSLTINGVGRTRGDDQLIVYTPQYDNQTPPQTSGVEVLVEMNTPNILTNGTNKTVGYIRDVKQNSGSTWIPFDHIVLSASGSAATTLLNNSAVGNQVWIYHQLTDKNEPTTSGTNACQTNTGTNWENTFASINTNYHFLKNDIIRSPDPNYAGYAGMIVRNPRTAICYNSNYVFFVVCDGRSAASIGWTSDEMADFCKNTLGATDGVNLDGGGSSIMVVNGAIQNVPSDGAPRPVANGVVMVNLQPKVQSSAFAVGQNLTVAAAANVRLGPGTNYGIKGTAALGNTATVLNHSLNGIQAKGYYWWKVSVNGVVGWMAESLLAGPISPPVITQQPVAQDVLQGSTAVFTIAAAGGGTLSYQWQKNSVNLSNGGHYSGVNTSSLTVSTADSNDVADYRCVVTNNYGSATSDNAALNIYTNILSNHGFETWALTTVADNWAQYNKTGSVNCYKGTTFTGTPSVTAHGGSQFQRVKLDSSSEEGGIYQRFASIAGVQYTVSAYLLTRLTNAGQAEAKLGVDLSGATVPGANTTWSTVVSGNSGWVQKTLTVTATGSYITVFLNGKHPESTTNQCNVFFDDAVAYTLCASTPSAPDNSSASPLTITSGQSSTLTSVVESGCTVDWYVGSCGGTFVGSGTSFSVSPTSTTTYYPRARNTTTGCVSSACGNPVTVTVSPGVALLNDNFESWAGSTVADDWTQYTTTSGLVCYKGSTFSGTPSVTAHGGSECQRVKLNASGAQGGVYQRFASVVGTKYTVSAYLLTRITSGGETVEAKLGVDPSGAVAPGANTVWSSTVSGDSSWTLKTLAVTATGSYITVFLDGKHPSSNTNQINVFFDDASIQ